MLLVERQPIYMEIDARHIFNADFSYPCPTSLFFLPSPSTSPPSPLVNLKNSLENVGLAERWGQKSMPPGMSIKMRISIVVPDTETEDYFGPAAPIFAPRIANFTGLPFFSLAPMTRPISGPRPHPLFGPHHIRTNYVAKGRAAMGQALKR